MPGTPVILPEVPPNSYFVGRGGYATLAAAVAALGSTPATVSFSSDQTLAANLTIPATLEIIPVNGAKIIHGAYTVAVASSTARWPLTQIFNGTGAVTGFSESKPIWFGAIGDGTTDDSAAAVKALVAIGAGGTLDGGGKTYLLDTVGLEVNTDNVFVKNATFKRTSTVNGYLLRYANSADTEGGGVIDVDFIGNPAVATGNGGLSMGSASYKANRYRINKVTATSFSQYGVAIEAGDEWQISNVRVLEHGLTVGVMASCIGFYVYPKHADTSRGGQLSDIYSEISAASQANASANHAAVKLQTHDNLLATNITAVGGFEESVSIDSIGGSIINMDITPQSGNRAGLSVGNQNIAHTESGKTFAIDGVQINGTSTNAFTISGIGPVTVTAVDTATDTLTSVGHGYVVNTPVSYTTDGTQIGGMVKEALYYVINPATDTFQLSATRGGATIDLTGSGSGTHQIQAVKLSNCAIRNIKGERASLLNNGTFKNCEFTGWDFTSIALDASVAATTAAVIANTGNIIHNVKARPSAATNRCAVSVSNSNVSQYGVAGKEGYPVGTMPQVNGRNNRIDGIIGGYLAGYNDVASLSDGAGSSVALSMTATSGIAMGDFVIPSASASVSGALLTAHVNAATATNIRLQNETGGILDLDNDQYRARKVRQNEMARYVVQPSVQFSASNLADGAGVATNVTIPGATMGDVVVMAWKSTVASLMPFAYISAPGVATCRLQNESGVASSAVTATADLNVATLRDESADYRNTVTYDPPSLADGEGVTVTFTVLGASVGDFVAVSFSNDLQGVMLTAEISANDTGSARFQNETGGPVDLTIGVLKALVFSAR
jgi:hypothetical protein